MTSTHEPDDAVELPSWWMMGSATSGILAAVVTGSALLGVVGVVGGIALELWLHSEGRVKRLWRDAANELGLAAEDDNATSFVGLVPSRSVRVSLLANGRIQATSTAHAALSELGDGEAGSPAQTGHRFFDLSAPIAGPPSLVSAAFGPRARTLFLELKQDYGLTLSEGVPVISLWPSGGHLTGEKADSALAHLVELCGLLAFAREDIPVRLLENLQRESDPIAISRCLMGLRRDYPGTLQASRALESVGSHSDASIRALATLEVGGLLSTTEDDPA